MRSAEWEKGGYAKNAQPPFRDSGEIPISRLSPGPRLDPRRMERHKPAGKFPERHTKRLLLTTF